MGVSAGTKTRAQSINSTVITTRDLTYGYGTLGEHRMNVCII
jgi:hypothetical protein